MKWKFKKSQINKMSTLFVQFLNAVVPWHSCIPGRTLSHTQCEHHGENEEQQKHFTLWRCYSSDVRFPVTNTKITTPDVRKICRNHRILQAREINVCQNLPQKKNLSKQELNPRTFKVFRRAFHRSNRKHILCINPYHIEQILKPTQPTAIPEERSGWKS